MSAKADYEYTIKVSLPEQEGPPEGFPIIYLLGGNEYFHFTRDIIQLQSHNSPKTSIHLAIVIGIEHKL